jgi:hypothetical protein
MNAPYNAECRITFEHNNMINYCKIPFGQGCPYQTNYINIYNHHNTNERYTAMTIKSNGGWNAYPLDGKRTFWAAAWHNAYKVYGFDYALGSIEGRWQDKSEF